MAAQTSRLVVELSPRMKNEIKRRADSSGLTISDFVRQATQNFGGKLGNEDRDLDRVLVEAKKALDGSAVAIDDALAFIHASNRRIEAMEAKAGTRPEAKPRRKVR